MGQLAKALADDAYDSDQIHDDDDLAWMTNSRKVFMLLLIPLLLLLLSHTLRWHQKSTTQIINGLSTFFHFLFSFLSSILFILSIRLEGVND